jgi:hypothetical protein
LSQLRGSVAVRPEWYGDPHSNTKQGFTKVLWIRTTENQIHTMIKVSYIFRTEAKKNQRPNGTRISEFCSPTIKLLQYVQTGVHYIGGWYFLTLPCFLLQFLQKAS